MMKCMFIVVLGGGIDLRGNLPQHVYQRLDEALKIYKTRLWTSQSDNDIKIVLSGKYSFLYRHQKPKFTEAHKMAQYLIKNGVPKKELFLETKSKDSIGNAYYLKKNVFIPKKEKEATIITSHFHLQRVKFIFHKIFGENYKFKFIGIQEHLPKDQEDKIIIRQKELLLKTQDLLSKMKIGEHNFLKRKIYNLRYYREKRPEWIVDFTAKGKI